MKNNNKYRNRNNNIKNHIVSPGIVVTNPVDYIPLWDQPRPRQIYKMPGETPYSEGSITNKKVNLYAEKDLTDETTQVRTMPIFGTPWNIHGVNISYNAATKQHTLNKAAKLANENAQIIRQTLIAKQQYQLNFLTEWFAPNPTVDPLFILGLATNSVGIATAMLFTRIFRTGAYIGAAMDYDKELANLYMDMQAAIQKRSMTASIGSLIGAFKSIVVDHNLIHEYTDLSHIEKNSKGYNTPFLWHDYGLSNETLDALILFYGDPNAPKQVPINFFDRTLWDKLWDSFFNLEHVDRLLNGQPCTYYNPASLVDKKTTSNIKEYIEDMRQFVDKITATVRASSALMTTYYAALTIIAETNVLVDTFKPNFDLTTLIPKASRVKDDYQLASLVNLISVYKSLNPTLNTDNNTININIPYYENFRPFPGTDGNALLKYIQTGEDYRPMTDLSRSKIGRLSTSGATYLDTWAKKGYVDPGTKGGLFYSTVTEMGRVLVKISQNSQGMYILGDGFTAASATVVPNQAYVAATKSCGQYFARYGINGMQISSNAAVFTNYVNGSIKMTYLSIAPYVYNTASYSMGVKNANRLF